MNPFRYERPADSAEAVALLERSPGGRFLGGGTNLVDLMRLGVETPDVLIDVRRLPLAQIEDVDGGGLRLGAAVSNSDGAIDQRVRARYPVVSEALLAGASGQLRNLATIGGNLLQRTRCSYFQDVTKPCNKRVPGSGCPAREGSHWNLAVLGHSPACVATHPSDLAVALTTLGATVHVEGRHGARTIPMPGFHRLPGDEPEHDTVLEHGELVTAVELAPPPPGQGTYRKVRERASFSFAVVSVAAVLALDGGRVSGVRLALGGVAHAPWRAERAEAALVGQPADEEHFRAAVDAELAAAEPLRDNAFKVPLARNVVVRTLVGLAERPEGGRS